MAYTIIGSGFGLYGYLPALVHYLHEDVTLPAGYREKVLSRPELSDCMPGIVWAADRQQALEHVDRAVVCLPPRLQGDMIVQLAQLPRLRIVVLEKPVAESPARASLVLNELYARGKHVVVNYSFRYTPWFQRFVDVASGTNPGRIEIIWSFRSHHLAHNLLNWKRFPEDGGGVIRFFGIHVIAALADAGYSEVSESRVESSDLEPAARWIARFTGIHGSPVDVTIDTNSAIARFSVRDSAGILRVELDDPFGETGTVPRRPGEDRRVAVVAEMLRSTVPAAPAREGYARVTKLWDAVESHTVFA